MLPVVTDTVPKLREMRDRFDFDFQLLADHPADRTYGNWVRYFVRNEYEDPFGE